MHNSAQDEGNFGRLEVAVQTLLSPSVEGRGENQDNYLLIDVHGKAHYLKDQREVSRQLANWKDGHVRVAILDGMGGHSFGRQAAERSVEGILEIQATANIGMLSERLDNLHLALHREMHVGDAEPGCTLTLLEIPPSGPALLFHVGDSRLYAINSAKAQFLTVDHIPATKLALYKLITRDEWYLQTHERSTPQISQAFVLGNGLGTPDLYSDQLLVELYELHDGNLPPFLQGFGDRRMIELQAGLTYLLASDGLWHLPRPQAYIQHWPSIMTRSDRPLSALLQDLLDELTRITRQEPRLRGDNSTAIALRLKR